MNSYLASQMATFCVAYMDVGKGREQGSGSFANLVNSQLLTVIRALNLVRSGYRKAEVVFRVLPLLVLIVAASIRPSMAASSDRADDDLLRLKRGEVLLQVLRDEKPGAAARVTALFHSSANVIWDVIGYCKYELIYMRGLKLCEMLEGDQFHMTMHHRLRNSWYTPTLDFIFEARREPGGSGQAQLVSGDLKVLEGSWSLSPVTGDNSVVVVHEVRIQPEIPAPKWLVRRSLRRDLPGMMACIRGLARASGDDGRIDRDLKQCPGDISGASK